MEIKVLPHIYSLYLPLQDLLQVHFLKYIKETKAKEETHNGKVQVSGWKGEKLNAVQVKLYTVQGARSSAFR